MLASIYHSFSAAHLLSLGCAVSQSQQGGRVHSEEEHLVIYC